MLNNEDIDSLVFDVEALNLNLLVANPLSQRGWELAIEQVVSLLKNKGDSMKDKLKIYVEEELGRAREERRKKADSGDELSFWYHKGYCEAINWTLNHLAFFRELIDLERQK